MSNREQDAKIAKLMGLPVRFHTDNPNNERYYYIDPDDQLGSELICEGVPDYSSDISLAMQAVEYMRTEREFFITIVPQMDGYLISVSDFTPVGHYYAHLTSVNVSLFEELADAICHIILETTEAANEQRNEE